MRNYTPPIVMSRARYLELQEEVKGLSQDLRIRIDSTRTLTDGRVEVVLAGRSTMASDDKLTDLVRRYGQ